MTGVPFPDARLALVLLAAALLLWASPRDVAVRRARALGRAAVASPDGRQSGRELPGTPRVRRWVVAGSAGVAVAVLVGGGPGAALAVGVTLGAERLLTGQAIRAGRAGRSGLARELPAACDLLGVCLAAGMPVAGALAAVAEAVPSPLGPALRGVAALYRMGAEPRRAWADVPPELAGLGRVVVRAGESGSTVAPALRALTADSRAATRTATEAAARRAGVWILAPLGLCFLPAFVCLGVVPLILGIAADVFR